ncbi:hypothetical protein [Streptomyces sp. CAU 1734]|uniref:hypothetical protein n=1 Tax=Streptomyces sp. CAU 1734 TaxID=3140360 RepID=UPI003260B976
MRPPRAQPVILLATTLSLAACSSTPSAPPAYALEGEACDAVSTSVFEPLTGPAPTKTSSHLLAGLSGGNCDVRLEGANGFMTLKVFIAINPDHDAARKMYDKFEAGDKTDADRADNVLRSVTVSQVKGLGQEAYLRRGHDVGKAWKPVDTFLYKYEVLDGSLVLSYLSSGYAKDPATGWPASEQELQDIIRKATEQLMKKIAE